MIALDALKRAEIEIQASRPYTDEHHRALAFGTWIARNRDPRYCRCAFRIGHCIPPVE